MQPVPDIDANREHYDIAAWALEPGDVNESWIVPLPCFLSLVIRKTVLFNSAILASRNLPIEGGTYLRKNQCQI